MSTFKKFIKIILADNTLDTLVQSFNKLQTNINESLAPMNALKQNDSVILKNISLITGKANTVNHTLGQNLVGWKITRKRNSAEIYDTQDNNTNPTQTLLLWTSANVVIDLEVF